MIGAWSNSMAGRTRTPTLLNLHNCSELVMLYHTFPSLFIGPHEVIPLIPLVKEAPKNSTSVTRKGRTNHYPRPPTLLMIDNNESQKKTWGSHS